MTTALAQVAPARPSLLAKFGDQYNVEPARVLGLLKSTVIQAKDREATDEECMAFLVVANEYGLNPFLREIHAFADPRRGVVPIVGIDGWIRLINREPSYDGLELEEHDTEDGRPSSVTCIIHIKGRDRPMRITEHISECRRQTPPWQTMPRRMLRHKAVMQCARYAFGFAGLHDDDEARDILRNAEATVRTVETGRATFTEASRNAQLTLESLKPGVADTRERDNETKSHSPSPDAPAAPHAEAPKDTPAESPGPQTPGHTPDGTPDDSAGAAPSPEVDPLEWKVIGGARAPALCCGCGGEIARGQEHLERYEAKGADVPGISQGRGRVKKHANCPDVDPAAQKEPEPEPTPERGDAWEGPDRDTGPDLPYELGVDLQNALRILNAGDRARLLFEKPADDSLTEEEQEGVENWLCSMIVGGRNALTGLWVRETKRDLAANQPPTVKDIAELIVAAARKRK